jgi:hypothetical protein
MILPAKGAALNFFFLVEFAWCHCIDYPFIFGSKWCHHIFSVTMGEKSIIMPCQKGCIDKKKKLSGLSTWVNYTD